MSAGVVFLGKTISLTVPFSTQEYKCIPANCTNGGGGGGGGGVVKFGAAGLLGRTWDGNAYKVALVFFRFNLHLTRQESGGIALSNF